MTKPIQIIGIVLIILLGVLVTEAVIHFDEVNERGETRHQHAEEIIEHLDIMSETLKRIEEGIN